MVFNAGIQQFSYDLIRRIVRKYFAWCNGRITNLLRSWIRIFCCQEKINKFNGVNYYSKNLENKKEEPKKGRSR